MSYDKGYLCLYFHDRPTLTKLRDITSKKGREKISPSRLVCNILKQVLPQLEKKAKNGGLSKFKIRVT